jgi:hypothetical protein
MYQKSLTISKLSYNIVKRSSFFVTVAKKVVYLKLRPGTVRSTRPRVAWPSGRSRGRPSSERSRCPQRGQRCRRKGLRVHPRRQCGGG